MSGAAPAAVPTTRASRTLTRLKRLVSSTASNPAAKPAATNKAAASRKRAVLGDISNRPRTRARVKQEAAAATPPPAPSAATATPEPELALDDVEMEMATPLAPAEECAEYAAEILEAMRVSELRHRASDSYIADVQADLTPHIRAMVVDWIVEVGQEYNFQPRTLYLAVDLIDRSLSRFAVRRSRLQLLSCACMLLASKYEEIYATSVDDMVYISDNTYSREDVLEMETKVLNALRFCLTVPTAHDFLTRFVAAAAATDIEAQLTHYLSELSLVHYEMLTFKPSLVAAGCVYLARATMGRPRDCVWTDELQLATGFTQRHLERCVRTLRQVHADEPASKLVAVRHKFNTTKTLHVSRIAAVSVEDIVV